VGWWHKPAGMTYNVVDYGASPAASGSTNRAAMNSALAAAAGAGGGTVYVPAGVYAMDGTSLVVSSKTRLVGEGDASMLDYSAVTTTTVAITATGTQSSPVAIASSAVEGQADLDVSGSGFANDDWIKVFSNAVTGANNLKKGEICQIKVAATMTLNDYLCDSYATADTASVAKLSFVTDVTVRDLKIVGPSNPAVSMAGIFLDLVLNASVSGVTCERTHNYGIGTRDSLQIRISDCYFNRNEYETTAYGVMILNASQGVSVANCTGWRLRHLVTHGGNTSVYGVARRTVTTGCIATQCVNSGFDAHGGGEDISFVGNTAIGSRSDGITFEAASGIIANNVIRDSLAPGIYLNTQSLKPLNVSVIGNNISGKANSTTRVGIRLRVVDGYELFDNVVIGNNVITDCVIGIQVTNEEAGAVQNLAITGNALRRCGSDSTQFAMFIQHADGLSVCGNSVFDAASGADGIVLSGCVGGTVSGNAVNIAQSGAVRCIRLLSSSKIAIEGNQCAAGENGVGIALDDASADCTVGNGNNVVGAPVGLSRGTGAHTIGRGEIQNVINVSDTFNLSDVTFPVHRVVRVAVASGSWNSATDVIQLPPTPCVGELVTVMADGNASVSGDNVPITSADTVRGNALINTAYGSRTYQAITDTVWQLIASA
jgi:hypothetical protein